MTAPVEQEGTPEAPSSDAWSQAGRLGFRAAQGVVALLLLAWAVGNVRQVPPDQRAVVLRFGEPGRVGNPGLLLARPEPIERVVFVPSAERQLDRVIERFWLDDQATLRLHTDADVRANRGFLLTGDFGVAHLNATLTYRIAEPIDYVIAADHVLPALERLFATSATTICAGRRIDALLATGSSGSAPAMTEETEPPEGTEETEDIGEPEEQTAALPTAADDRQRIRADLVKAVNERLAALAAEGAGLGIEVTRVDLTASLPPEAKSAFDAVPRAQQQAEQIVANARNQATRTGQMAAQDATRQALDAEARASEVIAKASSATAAISALSDRPADDPASAPVALQIYRERMADLLRRIGRVIAVDTRGGTRVVLPGPK